MPNGIGIRRYPLGRSSGSFVKVKKVKMSGGEWARLIGRFHLAVKGLYPWLRLGRGVCCTDEPLANREEFWEVVRVPGFGA